MYFTSAAQQTRKVTCVTYTMKKLKSYQYRNENGKD